MKALETMFREYFLKFKTRDLIMSGILVTVIIAYEWDGGEGAPMSLTLPAPQQQYTSAQPQPAHPEQYSRALSAAGIPISFSRNNLCRPSADRQNISMKDIRLRLRPVPIWSGQETLSSQHTSQHQQ